MALVSDGHPKNKIAQKYSVKIKTVYISTISKNKCCKYIHSIIP